MSKRAGKQGNGVRVSPPPPSLRLIEGGGWIPAFAGMTVVAVDPTIMSRWNAIALERSRAFSFLIVPSALSILAQGRPFISSFGFAQDRLAHHERTQQTLRRPEVNFPIGGQAITIAAESIK